MKPEKAEVLETAVNFLEEVGASKNSGKLGPIIRLKVGGTKTSSQNDQLTGHFQSFF